MSCGMHDRFTRGTSGISFLRNFWRNLKRNVAPSFSFDEQNDLDNDNNCNKATSSKRAKMNSVTCDQTDDEKHSFLEITKKLLSCSVCMEINSHSNQCKNGHLICQICTLQLQQNIINLHCPVCRIPIKGNIQRSLLAELLASELPASCRFCSKTMTSRLLKQHEQSDCSQRIVPCKYCIFGCSWKGKSEDCEKHCDDCCLAKSTVSDLREVVESNIKKQICYYKKSLNVWNDFVDKVKDKNNGVKFVIKKTILHHVQNESQIGKGVFIFQSSSIRIPFQSGVPNGLKIELKIILDKCGGLKIDYCLSSEQNLQGNISFFINSLYIGCNETKLKINDELRQCSFDGSKKVTNRFNIDFEIDSVATVNDSPLKNAESLIVDICLFVDKDTHSAVDDNVFEDNGITHAYGNGSNLVNNQLMSDNNNVVLALMSPSTEDLNFSVEGAGSDDLDDEAFYDASDEHSSGTEIDLSEIRPMLHDLLERHRNRSTTPMPTLTVRPRRRSGRLQSRRNRSRNR